MEELFDIDGKPLNLNQLKFLSDKGSECVVYKYNNSVIKLFRDTYKFSHHTVQEMIFLKNIPTKRILFPTGIILNTDMEMVGYQMQLIDGEKDIRLEKIGHILGEMKVLQNDLNLLNQYKIGLQDVNPSNVIYNGKLYLIDPGNYII